MFYKQEHSIIKKSRKIAWLELLDSFGIGFRKNILCVAKELVENEISSSLLFHIYINMHTQTHAHTHNTAALGLFLDLWGWMKTSIRDTVS